MPELPEVETMVRDLAPRVTGRRIVAIDAPFAGSVIYPSFEEFEHRVRAQEITGVTRRGKYAIFPLASGDLLIIHRGMTGSLLLRSTDSEMDLYVRLIFRLDGGDELRFRDARKFGKVFVMDASGEERALPWAAMGPEPLNGGFTVEGFTQALHGRTGPIKPLLLNQRIVAGLGNIYVDEALFLAGIHPQRIAGTLQFEEIERLHCAIRRVLSEAIARRGTTFSNYTDIEGRAGGYQDQLRVFQRTESTCQTCGTPIARIVLQGRGTHFCPTCQRA
jgi:formamidopyrimidine-DNA glycosylase